MPGGEECGFGRPLLDAGREGRVPESVIDDKVRRILRIYGRIGALAGRNISAGAGINADPVGRVAHHRPERFFPALISPVAEQRCFPKEKCCTEADDAHQKADDRRSGRAALFSPACVSWI